MKSFFTLLTFFNFYSALPPIPNLYPELIQSVMLRLIIPHWMEPYRASNYKRNKQCCLFFNVKAGTYDEQMKIPPIQGSSSLNTSITFQSESGDSSDVILQFDADTTLQ